MSHWLTHLPSAREGEQEPSRVYHGHRERTLTPPPNALTFAAWGALGYVVTRGEKARYKDQQGLSLFTPDQVKPLPPRVGDAPLDLEAAILNEMDGGTSLTPADYAFNRWMESVPGLPPIESLARAVFLAGYEAGRGTKCR